MNSLHSRKINHLEMLIGRQVQIKCFGNSSRKKSFAVEDDERGSCRTEFEGL